jgi:outer membrane protein OmpA-like peptidoglycan-associated protein
MYGFNMHEEEEEGAPVWLISFADLVMLILGFFVILYALNATPPVRAGAQGESDGYASASVPFDKWAEFVWNTRKAFGNPIDLDTTDPELRKVVDWYYSEGPGSAEDDGEHGEKREVHSPRQFGERSLMVDVKFAHETDYLTDSAMQSLAALATQVRGLSMKIEIHGHASNGEAGNNAEGGLSLSFRRAMIVARALADEGIAWRRMEIIAAGDHDPFNSHPVDSVDDAPNRRVEVRVTNRTAEDPVRSEPAVETP